MTGEEGAAHAAPCTDRGTGAVVAHQVSEEEIVTNTGGDAEDMIHMIATITVTIAMAAMVDVIVMHEATGEKCQNDISQCKQIMVDSGRSIRNQCK